MVDQVSGMSAKEILRQAGRVDEQNKVFNIVIKRLSDNLNNIAQLILSEDTSLASNTKAYASAYAGSVNNLIKKFDEMQQEMRNYAVKTLENEDLLHSSLQEVNKRLTDISAKLNTITGLENISI